MATIDLTRKKRFAHKVKTGCITCRKRRVKCDEERPSCRRCTSTGRTCDGYGSSSKSNSPDPDRSLSLLSGSIEEQRSIHFFTIYSAPQFGGLFDSAFWTQGVLQMSHANPAIRHAVSALGALHAKFLSGRHPVVPANDSDEDLKFALQQCNRSITSLMSQAEKSSEIYLTACVLFITFSSMQGHQLQAINHLSGGLRLLAGLDSSESEGSRNPRHPVQLETLRNMLTSFNFQVQSIMSLNMLKEWTHQIKMWPKTFPDVIDDVETAQSISDWLLYSSFSFSQSLERLVPTPENIEEIFTQHAFLVTQLDYAKLLTAEFMRRQALMLTEPQRLSAMRSSIYLYVADMFISICNPTVILGQGGGMFETAWDEFESQFTFIVEQSRVILLAGQNDDLRSKPSFSAGLGIVMPLFIVASRCRHPQLRREAIQLLLDYPRREGVWDSRLAAKIAASGMEIEEAAFRLYCEMDPSAGFDGVIPEECRNRSFEILYIGDRKAEVMYWNTQQWLKAETGIMSILEW